MTEDKWNKDSKNYERSVYSITKWKEKRDRILDNLRDGQKILILGCGSEVYLQKDILKKFPRSQIVLSDFSSGMLRKSKKDFNHKNLVFKKEDMMDLEYQEEFDVIISTNSILMSTIKKNNKVFDSCKEALKRDGKLIAYLPSFESCENVLAKIQRGILKLKKKNQVLMDSVDKTEQSFHSISSIDNIARGFKSLEMKKVYCSESKAELEYLSSLYEGVMSREVCSQVFEWFVVLTKR